MLPWCYSLIMSNVVNPSAHAGGNTEFLRRAARVLIQEMPTLRYYHQQGNWVSDESRATNFQTGTAALEFARTCGLTNIQVVIAVETTERRIHPVFSSLRR